MTSKILDSNSTDENNLHPGNKTDEEEVISPTSAEYVKRTARLFENARISKDGRKQESERKANGGATYVIETGIESENVSADATDLAKKPSYLGVSCSNSGYRNVINYDSKLREGFWSSNNQRESLVLSNHRLRDSSPLKFDQECRTHNGHRSNEPKTATATKVSHHSSSNTRTDNTNGYRTDEFVNISTSTKTISTFRNSCTKTEINQSNVNGHPGSEETWRKSSYTSVGISPKVLKSPEKNCNSFLRSINSFESNCRKSQIDTKSYRTFKPEGTIQAYNASNSIQQRIERLYGPGALAQGFYAQTCSTKPRPKGLELSEETNQLRFPENVGQSNLSIRASIESIPDLLPAAPEVVLPIDQYSNGGEEAINGSSNNSIQEEDSNEKNGRYFLKLLQKEIDKLERLATFAETELENGENLPEEASGKLRAAAGKARLLVRQKLHQFEGLCQKNLNEKPGEQFPTTSEDLAGFWDMVMLQVMQVYGVFDEIDELKKNNWKPIAPGGGTNGSESTKKSTRKSTPAGSQEKNEKAEQAKKAREEARRKMMEERRRKMKELRENKTVGSEGEIEIFAK